MPKPYPLIKAPNNATLNRSNNSSSKKNMNQRNRSFNSHNGDLSMLSHGNNNDVNKTNEELYEAIAYLKAKINH